MSWTEKLLALHDRPQLRAPVGLVAPRVEGRLAAAGALVTIRPDADAELAVLQRLLVDGRVDITRDTRIDLGSRLRVGTDNPGSPNLQARPRHGSCRYSRPLAATAGTWPSLQPFRRGRSRPMLSACPSELNADRRHGPPVTTIRNYNQFGGTLRQGYELSPGSHALRRSQRRWARSTISTPIFPAISTILYTGLVASAQNSSNLSRPLG